jgi:hypothetical protein
VHLGVDVVVVTVDRLANVARVGDEVGGAEDEPLFVDADVVGLGHAVLDPYGLVA